MRGADIMMGHVESDGKVVVGDYHATGNTVPIKDGCQVCVGGCMVCALGPARLPGVKPLHCHCVVL